MRIARRVLVALVLLGLAAAPRAYAADAALPYALADSGVFGHRGDDADGLIEPAGLASDAFGHVWVSDAAANRLLRFDAAGRLLGQSGALGSDDRQFRRPTTLARLGSSGVAVLDLENRRIVTYDMLGRFALVLVQLDSDALDQTLGRITPVGLAADRGGALAVADAERDRVIVFDFSGTYVRAIGGYGLAPGSFHGLRAVALAPRGECVTVERAASLPRKGRASAADSAAASGARVQRLDPGGAPIAAWTFPARGEEDFAVAVDDSGRVAVSDAERGVVRLFAPDGTRLAERDGFADPRALTFAADGALLVAEAGSGRVRRLVRVPAAAKE